MAMDTGTALMMGPRPGVAELIRQLGSCQPGTQGREIRQSWLRAGQSLGSGGHRLRSACDEPMGPSARMPAARALAACAASAAVRSFAVAPSPLRDLRSTYLIRRTRPVRHLEKLLEKLSPGATRRLRSLWSGSGPIKTVGRGGWLRLAGPGAGDCGQWRGGTGGPATCIRQRWE